MIRLSMPTVHCQKHSFDRDSVSSTTDANDSGFSEIYHACEGEEGVSVSSQAASNRLVSETVFNNVSIKCSTPNRSSVEYLCQAIPVSSGISEYTANQMAPHAAECGQMKTAPSFTESVSSNIIKTQPQFDSIQWMNAQPRAQSPLYQHQPEWPTSHYDSFQNGHFGVAFKQTAKENCFSKDFQEDLINKRFVSSTPSNNLKRNPAKIKIDILDNIMPNIPNTPADSKVQEGDITPYTNSSKVQEGDITPYTNSSKLTDLLFKNDPVQPTTMPMLDVRNQNLPTFGQFLKIPSSIRPVALTVPIRKSIPNATLPSYTAQTLDLSSFPAVSTSVAMVSDFSSNKAGNSAVFGSGLALNSYSGPLQYVTSHPNSDISIKPYKLDNIPKASHFTNEFAVEYNICKDRAGLAIEPAYIAASRENDNAQMIHSSKVSNLPSFDLPKEPCCGKTFPQSSLSNTEDAFSFCSSQKCFSRPSFRDFSDEESQIAKVDLNNNTDEFALQYSDISTEDSNTDSPVTSESSCDEAARDTPVFVTRKNKKFKRKSQTPRKSPDKRDPRFKGVTIWLQTEFNNGKSQLRLSAFYSNVKAKVTKPGYSLCRNPSVPRDSQSCSEAEAYSPLTPVRETYGTAKTCASCRTRRTPLWRDAEDGTPLCNACGIRYKKYRLRCSRCWFIPKKDIKTYPNCPACGSALRYSFHRKAW